MDVLLLNIIRPTSYAERFPYIFDIKYIFSNIFLIFQHSYFGVELVNSVAWSLDLELHWYLFAPVLYYFLYYKSDYSVLRMLIFISYLVSVLILYDHLGWIFRDIPFFIYGFFAYEIYLLYQRYSQNQSTNKYILITVIVLLSLPFLDLNYDVDATFIIYFCTFLICMTLNFSHKIDKLLGDLSFPLFILHQPLFFIAFLQVNKYGNIFRIDKENFSE